jgi:hypothetical protein
MSHQSYLSWRSTTQWLEEGNSRLATVTVTWWKDHGMAQLRRTASTSAMAARPRRRQEGTGTGQKQCPKFIPRARSFAASRYLRATAHKSQRRRRSLRGITSGEFTEPGFFFRSLYHQNPIQSAWQRIFRGDFHKFLCGNSLIGLQQN